MTTWVWQRFAEMAATRGAARAVTHGSDSISFAALHKAAANLGGSLTIAPGDRVILCGENSIPLITLVAAIWRQGGIVTMLHPDAPLRHVQHAIETVAPAAFYCDDPEKAAGFGGIVIGAAPPSPASPASAPDDLSAELPASIMFTSGSTGLPKGVTQSAGNLIDGSARVGAMLGYAVTDSILCPIPFAFDYGWGHLLSMLLQGIPLVLPAPRNSFGLCAALADHRPTVFAGVPAVFADLLGGLAPIQEVDRRSVRLITNTGSKIPPTVFREMLRTFPDAKISLNYGLTETYRSASLPVEMAESNPTSVGHAIPGVLLEVLRPDGSPADPDEEGEIVHRGAGVFLSYWNNPTATAQVRGQSADGVAFVRTGDLGHKDAAGLLYIHGRRDSQIKSMGVRVSPDEVEAILHESGLVREVAVTRRAHDTLGDMIVACVVLKDGDARENLKALKRYARAEMSPYMQPRDYVVMQALPRTTSGKVAYALLRDPD